MNKTWKRLLSFMLVIALGVTALPAYNLQAEAAEETKAAEYTIYPTPQSIVYNVGGGTLELPNEVNVVYEDGIDQATKDRMEEVLAIKDIKAKTVNAAVSGQVNILVGIAGSNGAADRAKDLTDEELFNKVDSYLLSIKDKQITVVGRDTDAAFYALASLKMILEQSQGNTIRQLQMEDYAVGQYRGFIEGYYGIPWSVEDRISLMQFGGDFKMNIYIFAPKDDPYHNKQWREPYPEDKLKDIERMVDAGAAAKCRFAWAIHPFMNDAITLDDYETGLAAIQNKFQHLYDSGVRQFVISADDANSPVTLQARLCRDMTEWVKAHEGCYNLVFVPQVYCTSALTWSNWGWTGSPSLSQYFGHFTDIEDLEIMWTGEWVCHPVTQGTFNNFKQNSGKEAFMWLNWPVNDVNHKRLVMGPAENCVLNTGGVTGFKGIVTNPLEQGEASKTALFAIADYAWNTKDFDCQKSWADCFQYIDSGASDSLHELCKHMTNPSPGGITGMGESVELTPYITAFTNAYNNGNGTDYEEEANALITQMQKIVDAANDFQKNGTNANLIDEMNPWVDSLRYLSQAVIGFIRTAIALKNNDAEGVWNNYSKAANAYKASQNCYAPQLEGTIAVEAGAMKIIPLANTLESSVKSDALEVLENNFGGGDAGDVSDEQSVIYGGIGGFYEGTADKIIDKNDSTYVWFNNTVEANGYIGLDLGNVYKLDNIRILQGKNDTDSDIFTTSVLEYSLNNTDWETIGNFSERTIETNVLAQSINARYVRLRTPSTTGKWYAIREFTVTTRPAVSKAYTNVDSLKETEVIIDRNNASIGKVENITLKNGEYFGLAFPAIRALTSVSADYTNKDKLAFECSANGTSWSKVPARFDTLEVKYIRIANNGSAPVTFTVNGVQITNEVGDLTTVAVPEGKEGCEALKATDGSIYTAFEASDGPGSLRWRIDSDIAGKLYVLQDAEKSTGAKVFIRLESGVWTGVGELSKGLNLLADTAIYGPICEVKIEWKENGPRIYEIYTKESDKSAEQILQEIVDNAKDRNGTAGSQLVDSSIKDAETLLAKPNKTQQEIAALIASLSSIVSKELPNNYEKEARQEALSALQTRIASVKDLAENGKNRYTAESFHNFIAVYQNVLNPASNTDAETLKQYLNDLNKAVSQLEENDSEYVDALNALQAAAAAVKALAESGGTDYTPESWKVFMDAYNAALNPAATADLATLKKLLADLNDAAGKLVKQSGGIDNPNPPAVSLKKGETFTSGKLKYKVTDASKKEVAVVGPKSKNASSLTIPATVQRNGVSCKVTSISANALSKMPKLTKVTIGVNVTSIGKKAFFNDKALKTIIVKSKKLKTVAANAFKGTKKTGSIKVPKGKKKSYQKLFKNIGNKKIK